MVARESPRTPNNSGSHAGTYASDATTNSTVPVTSAPASRCPAESIGEPSLRAVSRHGFQDGTAEAIDVNQDASQSAGPATTNYYGPTSAHFEAPTPQGGRGVLNRPERVLPPELVEKVLMAEAAHQRQMEIINFAAGKLDFDGVDPELGLHLLSLHWNRQHHSFLLTYRPAFMRDMACGGKYFSKLLLNAIYFGASKFSPRLELRRDPDDVRTAGWTFRQRVKDLLGGALDRSEITTIQALLVMTNSLFALGDERSAAWLYAGLAFRMVIDLGIHVDRPYISGSSGLSEEDVEIHRRVFWGAFVVDKIQSLYQGRPPSLQDIDTRVPLVFRDRYEELDYWTPFAFNASSNYPGCPAYSVSTFTELCKLCVIMNQIINKLYAEKSVRKHPSQLHDDLEALKKQLELWSRELPEHLVYPSAHASKPTPPPHVLSLQAMFNVLLILLNRPFVSEGRLESQTVAAEAFASCATAATRIVHLLEAYERAFSIARAPYLISYATYVSATIHVRIAAQREPGSEAHICLQTCLGVLETNQETNWAVRKATKVIIDLADRMNVKVRPTSHRLVADSRVDSMVRPGDDPARENNSFGNFAGRPDSSLMTPSFPNEPSSAASRQFDMDAIIQSFMQEQSELTSRNQPTIQYAAPNAGNLTSPGIASVPRQLDPWQTGTDPLLTPDFLPDDALFGFNRVALDPAWVCSFDEKISPRMSANGRPSSWAPWVRWITTCDSSTASVAAPPQHPRLPLWPGPNDRTGKLDFSGNCGNMVSGVGPFAVDEGMVMAEPGASKANVRIFNTNTGRLIVDTVELDETGLFEPNGDCRIGGFGGTGSRIDVSFVEPAGSMTGKLLPTGQPEETLCIDFGPSVGKHDVRVTLLDAANPFIFVDQSSLPQNLSFTPDSVDAHAWVEQIRRAGAVRYGLAATVEDAAKVRGTPKIAFLQPPEAGSKQDIRVLSYSMGKPHPSLQLTGAVCLAAALCVPGTVAHRLSRSSAIAAGQGPPTPPESEDGTGNDGDGPSVAVRLSQKQERTVLVGHPTGQIEVTVGWQLGRDGEVAIGYAKVFRTARRIFAGEVVVDLACGRQMINGEEAV
ncbi:PrpF protein-domain-containing protein [Chaetomium tenue]|uniref:PrpF protein-domain-containing protein n=1 Tax=Chaetomium tenue TaxID=1854479 RepID=A0ACB7P7Z9_9PEZI|nr:PrpF protein-domain-containing protein [Chaetomium globosum]